jgi:polysaccharide export outer membrane protein
LIGPGDTLHIVVLETPDLEQQVRVMDDGTIRLTLGGSVKVVGLEPGSAAQAIEAYLLEKNYLRQPHVQVAVVAYATQKVTVLGEVKQPGQFEIGTPRSILDVLAMAGGLTDIADRNLTVMRHDTREQVSYFVSNTAAEAIKTEILVYPGDKVIAAKAGIVYALGDFARPGGYTITNNYSQLTILQLVARAGGTNHSAVPSHARLVRKAPDGSLTDIPLQLGKMQKGKIPDMTLQTDDILYVPFSYVRNFMLNGSSIAASAASAAIYHF